MWITELAVFGVVAVVVIAAVMLLPLMVRLGALGGRGAAHQVQEAANTIEKELHARDS